MKQLLVLFVSLLGITCENVLNGFRVKHAWSGALNDVEYFYSIPKTIEEAEQLDFVYVQFNPDNDMIVQLRCYNSDARVCALFDRSGNVAGLQLAIPEEDVRGNPYDYENNMKLRTIQNKRYWTATHYLVSPEKLKHYGRVKPISETMEELWLERGNILMNIPTSEKDIVEKTLFKKQNCIPGMGTHYYYNMTSELECSNVFPYFLLVKNGRVIGIGFQIFGKLFQHDRDWFEKPPPRAVEMTIPSAPACLEDWSRIYGVISLHIYYVDEPWEITCADGDSLQPMSVVNKFLLNSSRYAGKVLDGVKKVFKGLTE